MAGGVPFFFTGIGVYLLIRAYDENAAATAIGMEIICLICLMSLFMAEDRMKAWKKRNCGT